jgi:phosphoribosylanthranilate isomerase
MSLWIKICGNTSAADALLAVEAGADAVGFVFAASPRRVTESEAAGIVSHLPKTVETIGVFVDATVEEIYSAVRMCHLTGVQLHWDAAADMPARLKSRLGHEAARFAGGALWRGGCGEGGGVGGGLRTRSQC